MSLFFAVIRFLKLWLVLTALLATTSAHCGPLAGSQYAEDTENVAAGPAEATDQPEPRGPDQGTPNLPQSDELVSSYVETLRRQMLLSFDGPALLNTSDGVNLDGLQGWSLEEISEAMGQLVRGLSLSDSLDGNISVTGGSTLDTASIEDLYAFNVGNSVFTSNPTSTAADQTVNAQAGAEAVELLGLSTMTVSLMTLTGAEFGQTIGTQTALFDSAYFQTVSRPKQSASSGQLFGRGGLGLSSGGSGQSGGTNGAEQEVIPLIEFIQRVIDGVLRNWLTILLVTLGLTSVGFFATRMGHTSS